jgi:hypothetical protein
VFHGEGSLTGGILGPGGPGGPLITWCMLLGVGISFQLEPANEIKLKKIKIQLLVLNDTVYWGRNSSLIFINILLEKKTKICIQSVEKKLFFKPFTKNKQFIGVIKT